MTASKISGAELPSAMSVRLAMVSFHTCTVSCRGWFVAGSEYVTVLVVLVMTSMLAMNMSAMIAMPMKLHSSATRYTKERSPVLQLSSAMNSGRISPGEHTSLPGSRAWIIMPRGCCWTSETPTGRSWPST